MTVGLCIITKDYDQALHDRLSGMLTYFNEVYIQINGDQTGKEDQSAFFDNMRKFNISTYRWNDNFADARNALQKHVETDYWMWMDTDDEIFGLENLKDVLAEMEANDVDVMYAPYHYEIKNGQTVILQYRERILKRIPGKWLGRVHETFVPDVQIRLERTTKLQWKHNKTDAEYAASKARNLKILEEEANKKDPDPRDLHYLALAYDGEHRWAECIEWALKYIKVGGWDEEIYRSWILIAKCEAELEQYEKAIAACMAATRVLPNYFDAYYDLADIYYSMGDYSKSLDWYNVGQSKPAPRTNSPADPTIRAYRATFQAAMAYSMLGKVHEAYELMERVAKLAPDSEEVKEWLPDIRGMYHEARQIERLEEFAAYYSVHGGDLKLLYKSLPPQIQAYPQISMMMKQYEKPKTWPEKSVVFFCGPGLEPWGPDFLDKGVGGSEEAVIYLSRELTKLGWEVTVYNERAEQFRDVVEISLGIHTTVLYLPWQEFNPNDTFDVLVAWRNPGFFRQSQAKARLKLVDMHDTPIGHQKVKEQDLPYIDKLMLKSNFQSDWAEGVPKDKIEVISNGIVKEQFDVRDEKPTRKRPARVSE